MTTREQQAEYRRTLAQRGRTTAGWLTFTAAVFLAVTMLNAIAGRVL